MTREEALAALASSALDERLEAARTLAVRAIAQDAPELQKALSAEKVLWVSTALRRAIARIAPRENGEEHPDEGTGDIVSLEAFGEIKAIAISAVTKQIVHEIAPVVGVLRLHARDEVESFEQSKTREQIDRLGEWLDALDRLSRASVAPVLEEFDLSALVRRLADTEIIGHRTKVELAGPTPLLVIGDPSLAELTLANGLRNAIEAVEHLHAASADVPPVVINWGDTDRDTWVAVLDRGIGPPLLANRAFDIGSTTKEGHLGMGLATARQAMESLSGTVTLSLRSEGGGARFDFRWPRFAASG